MKLPIFKIVPDGDSGDYKRAFYCAETDNEDLDLRIEVDTDDCDARRAKAAMKVVIRALNEYNRNRSSKKKKVETDETL